MTKENIEVLDVEVKLDKNENKYLRVKTDKGWMSCFKSNCIEQIKNLKGKTIAVETITAGKFTNIERYIGEADPQTEDEQAIRIEKVAENGCMEKKEVLGSEAYRVKALELALKHANKDTTFEVIFTIADKYFKYIIEGS